MTAYAQRSKEELLEEKKQLEKALEEYKKRGLSLDMSRGKPSPAQLDLCMGLLDTVNSSESVKTETGVDCRNYGILDGIPEAKRLMASLVGVAPEQVILYGNSSLNIMYDAVSRSMSHGVMGSTPWCRLDRVKFLCPVPGYDRHFAVTEFFGIELIPVPMTPEGPDMELVERLVAEDDQIKGIWCVPKYSNPQGYTYSEQTVRRMAALKPAAKDFRIYWDNAYCVHHLYFDEPSEIPEILSECERAGNPDLVYEFFSTSKISFPGAGLSAIAASKANLEDIRKQLFYQSIGFDKLNQLRHVRFFKDRAGVMAHMEKQAAIMRPKFEAVQEILETELGGLGVGEWTKPRGGYFISFDAMEGCAKAIVAKMREAGVVMTGAGATWPGKQDPKDSNIRIAPTYPEVEELKLAAEVFTVCVRLVSVEKLLSL